MNHKDIEFEEGRDYGKHELKEKLIKYAQESTDSRVLEVISNALYHVGEANG